MIIRMINNDYTDSKHFIPIKLNGRTFGLGTEDCLFFLFSVNKRGTRIKLFACLRQVQMIDL